MYRFVFLLMLIGCGTHNQDPSNFSSDGQNQEAQIQRIVTDLLNSDSPAHRYAKNALSLKRHIDGHKNVSGQNRTEIERLLNNLRDVTYEAEFDQLLVEKLTRDKQLAEKLKASLYQPDGRLGTIPLRSNLGKLIASGEGLTGIYDDAITMFDQMKNLLKKSSLGGFEPKANEITVLKTLLIYMNLVSMGSESYQWLEHLHLELLYSSEWPKEVANIGETEFGLYDAATATIRMPNAGYVYGGVIQEEGDQKVCRGLDCSSMLSFATESADRLTTMVMEYTWLHLADKRYFASEEEQGIRDEFMADYGMASAVEEFDAIMRVEDKLIPGDLIVWRWKNKPEAIRNTSGHVAMYLGKVNEQILTVEVNRKNDKSQEGFLYGLHDFNKDGDTYVLRRKVGLAGNISSLLSME